MLMFLFPAALLLLLFNFAGGNSLVVESSANNWPAFTILLIIAPSEQDAKDRPFFPYKTRCRASTKLNPTFCIRATFIASLAIEKLVNFSFVPAPDETLVKANEGQADQSRIEVTGAKPAQFYQTCYGSSGTGLVGYLPYVAGGDQMQDQHNQVAINSEASRTRAGLHIWYLQPVSW